MNTQYPPEYDDADEPTRAERLPQDFGHDHPEVVRLKAIRDELCTELENVKKIAYDFNSWRIQLIREQSSAEIEIAEIDRQRPHLLAEILSGNRDFTRDDQAQARRAELKVIAQRIEIAMPLLDNQTSSSKDRVHALHERHHKAFNDVEAKLEEVRRAHVRR